LIVAKPKPSTVRLLRSPTAEEPGVLCLKSGKKFSFYTFQEIPCEIGGRGFAMHRLGMGDLYHVRIDTRADSTCECMGFLRHGHCKHILALTALVENSRI
jgi:hypothetical protein